ncbi:hypothetical protein FHS85_002888 [Rhodoligotrophos appendicifer]|uniref:hypothetical protein n=1 Tax=Rhodoligotrophos appendicifer TaxID=987056 RepID=UPI0011865BC1|nr:hypothetical protein [Rhodoligotrophos appendicifer]
MSRSFCDVLGEIDAGRLVEELTEKLTDVVEAVQALQRLVSGAPIHLRVLGTVHPPVMIDVGEVPKETI